MNQIEIQNNGVDKIKQNEVEKSYEKLENSGEKGTFEKAFDKVGDFYEETKKGIEEDIDKKNWGKLLLKGAIGIGSIFLVKKATELVGSAFSGIKDIFGFGKENLDGNKEKTGFETFKWLLGIAGMGSVATVLYDGFKGGFEIKEWTDAWSKGNILGIGNLIIEKIKNGSLEIGEDGKKLLYEIPLIGGMIKDYFEKGENSEDEKSEKETNEENSSLEKAKKILKENPSLEKTLKGILTFTSDTAINLSKDIKENHPDLSLYLPDLENIGNGTVLKFVKEALEMGIGEEKFTEIKETGKLALNSILTLYLTKKFVETGLIGKSAIAVFIGYGLKKKFTFFDEVTDELLETITDPYKFFENSINGKFNFIIGEGNLVATTTGLNPVSLTFNIGQGFINTMEKYYEENDLLGMIAVGTGGIFVGRSLGHGLKGQYELLFDRNISESFSQGIWRTLKSVIPFSKEWKYVMNSAKEGFPFYKKYEELKIGYKLGNAEALTEEMKMLLEKENPDFSKIGKKANKLKNSLPEINFNNLPENKTFYNFYESIREANTFTSAIEKMSAEKNKEKIIENLNKFSEKIKDQKTISTKIVSKMKLLSEGKISEAMRLDKLYKYGKEKFSGEKSKTPEINKKLEELKKSKISNPINNLKFKPKLKGKLALASIFGLGTYAAANEITGNNDQELEGKKETESGIENEIQEKNNEKLKIVENYKKSEIEVLEIIPDDENLREKFLENYENRKNLKEKLEDLTKNYKEYLSEIKNYISKNKDELKKDLDKNEKLKISDTVYLIKNQNGELELKYISSEKYSEFIHSQFQKKLSGEKIGGIPEEVLVETGTSMIPFYGSGRDLKRAIKNFQSGNSEEGWNNLKWGISGGTFDAASVAAGILTFGVGGALIQAGKFAVMGSMRGIKSAKNISRLTKTAQITGGTMIGMTIYDFGKNPENFDKNFTIK